MHSKAVTANSSDFVLHFDPIHNQISALTEIFISTAVCLYVSDLRTEWLISKKKNDKQI